LQLSRLERGGNLNPVPVNLTPFIQNLIERWGNRLQIDFVSKDNLSPVLADQFALTLVLRNLLENTRTHAHKKNEHISVSENDQEVRLTYQDDGLYEGDFALLGTLFYKYNSTKGSGIGLYLIKRLMQKMNGDLKIDLNERRLTFTLIFSKASGAEERE